MGYKGNEKRGLIIINPIVLRSVAVGPDFYCNRIPPPFSPAYRQAHAAVDKLLYESYLAGHGLILPPGALHSSRLGLTLKKGKKSGRVTCNDTHSVLGHSVGSLNSDHVIYHYDGEEKIW